MDPRQRGDSKVSKLEPSNIKMLKLQPSIVLQQQSRVAVAMGNKKGEIRLFNKNLLRSREGSSTYLDYKPKATTSFPA